MKVCDHDWETVKVSGTLERMIESIDGVSDVDADFRMGLPNSRILVSFKFGGERYHVFEPKGIKTNPVQKVCLKCNKCVDEIKVVRGRWVDLITEEINKEKERDIRICHAEERLSYVQEV
jgi:hypothetical protein